jgi:uncharacterized protein YlbG (UPF0298 family)
MKGKGYDIVAETLFGEDYSLFFVEVSETKNKIQKLSWHVFVMHVEKSFIQEFTSQLSL